MFGKGIKGICDRCGLAFRLRDLKPEYVMGKKNGLLVCRSCVDPSHPQLDTRGLKTADKQSVKNSRSDSAELEESRRLSAWNPVGAEASGAMDILAGRVTVTIT